MKKINSNKDSIKKLKAHFTFDRIRAHILIIIILSILLLITTLLFLNIYTNHNTVVKVPDYTKMFVKDAQAIAEKNNFMIEIIDSSYVKGAKPGNITDQIPLPGTIVKEHRKIFVSVNSFLPEKIRMPDLVNTSLRQALNLIESHGLVLGRLKYVPDFAKDYVLSQTYRGKKIKKGQLIDKGAKIDLVLGMGENTSTTLVPDLSGLTYKEALNKITSQSLNIGSININGEIESKEDSLKAVVVRQSPEYSEGKTAYIGSMVDIWLEIEE